MFSKIRELSKNITVYGLGDVAVSVINFLLLGVYVLFFSPADYGVISVLGALEVIAKIVFRFGLDGSFMRFYYDAGDDDGRVDRAVGIDGSRARHVRRLGLRGGRDAHTPGRPAAALQ